MYKHRTAAGFSLVEVIVVSAMSVIVFGALFASYKYSLDLISLSRAKLSALSVANDRMEYFRSLPYDDVGTVAGIPSGSIPQNSTTTLNGIDFRERVLVEYVDDPADGVGASDATGIVSDYKRLKLEYSWETRGETNKISLVSNIVPRSVETTAGGGTVRVNVIDENSVLLPGASVRLFNNTISPVVDVTRFTDSGGVALFAGAPTSSDYEVEVTANISGNQYSTDQTYQVTIANPNPIVAPFAVLEADVSTLTFQIGELSDLNVSTRSSVSEGMFREEFSVPVAVSSSSVEVVSGSLMLENTAGVYDTSGYIYLGPVTPASLSNWQSVRVAASLPANTTHKVSFYTGPAFGPYILIPDTDLPGNSVGFTETIIDISELDTIAYPTLSVGITLETADTNVTSRINEISVFYRESETALANISFDIQGNKIIGTDASAAPIYKYTNSLQTNGAGTLIINDLEFDSYSLDFGIGYDVAMACPTHPFVQKAGVDGDLEVVLVPNTTNNLRVLVVDSLSRMISGASVSLQRTGYNVTLLTDGCGQAFFSGGVSADNDYKLDVSTTGYNSESVDPFEISGTTTATIVLTE